MASKLLHLYVLKVLSLLTFIVDWFGTGASTSKIAFLIFSVGNVSSNCKFIKGKSHLIKKWKLILKNINV